LSTTTPMTIIDRAATFARSQDSPSRSAWLGLAWPRIPGNDRRGPTRRPTTCTSTVAQSPELEPCRRLYVEAAALGLLGREPYASVVREANEHWLQSFVTHLTNSGVAKPLAKRAATVVDAAFLGFQLDAPLDVGTAARKRAVADLADAVAALVS
jgi:hypothetical protein